MKTTDKKRDDILVGRNTKDVKTLFRREILDKCGPNARKLMLTLIPSFVIIWFMFSFGLVRYDITFQAFSMDCVRSRVFALQQPKHQELAMDSRNFIETKIDKLLRGLLAPGFDETSCISRYNSGLYRKQSAQSPSALLISKLRAYEALHKRCGPDTESYRKTLENHNSGKISGPSDCNYVVWISYNGLGNRMLTLASTFLYALLTNRVLLVDNGKDMADLFCEPFPDTSWLLPTDFPLISKIDKFNQKSNFSYGNRLKANINNNISGTTIPSISLYIYRGHDYDDHDTLFFCDEYQSSLTRVPLLIIKTDNYFIPSLFLTPLFEQELTNLFPNKETVFHFLGRYLFHPTNPVWGLITRFYEAYLENTYEKIGVQLTLLEENPNNLQYVFDQVLNCLVKETKLIPEITKQEHNSGTIKSCKTKTVLVTSLYSGYYEKLRELYWEKPTTTGEVVRFFQPSYEKYEPNENKMRNMKAWAEIYLLSLTDNLVTSTRSTFGYVAQSLGGSRPWILYEPENQTAPDPPCHQGSSLEPCEHTPANYDCKKRTWVDKGALVPYVRHCEDESWGQKLFDIET